MNSGIYSILIFITDLYPLCLGQYSRSLQHVKYHKPTWVPMPSRTLQRGGVFKLWNPDNRGAHPQVRQARPVLCSPVGKWSCFHFPLTSYNFSSHHWPSLSLSVSGIHPSIQDVAFGLSQQYTPEPFCCPHGGKISVAGADGLSRALGMAFDCLGVCGWGGGAGLEMPIWGKQKLCSWKVGWHF